MPSPRSSPALRPSSPLTPGYKASTHFDSLQPPSPRALHARAPGNSSRRANNASLKLPSLPRFHPANFPSAHSSQHPTPDAESPNGPLSPKAYQRMLSDAQKQLYHHQREMVLVARASSPGRVQKPEGPRLAPAGSPGPVTPLELGGEEGYLVAGARSAGKDGQTDELVDRFIREEAGRRRRTSQSPSRFTTR